ncbi:hypothetical protein [Nocardia harenae]|uniref:hypothetical protein n=1 Tax=Nocardia harenae TaxID=358707 RepID=UPI000AA50C29|nr:hypothetical protein [Nocardia harenae]
MTIVNTGRRSGHKPSTALLASAVAPRRPAVPFDIRHDFGAAFFVAYSSAPAGRRGSRVGPEVLYQRLLQERNTETAPPEPTAGDLDSVLEQLDPDTAPARDAEHFRHIIEARKKLADAEAELRSAVKRARQAGDSWTVIGAALDTSRQAAFQRFGKD